MAYTGCTNQSSLFGSSEKYIKFLNGDLVAIEGVNTVERQFLKDLRIPYTQILKGRVVLKAGQVDYLLNHLGLGDNATFLSLILSAIMVSIALFRVSYSLHDFINSLISPCFNLNSSFEDVISSCNEPNFNE